MITIKSKHELEIMREAGRIVAMVHDEMKRVIHPGITTRQLDTIAENIIRKAGATPSFKGYNDFPASICTSVNEQLVHGIPSDRALVDGDIISVDVGAYYKGYHGDSAWTYPVGTISAQAVDLLAVTQESLFQGIREAKPGNRLSDVSHAVQIYAESKGYSIVRDYVGHGIGRDMHESPQVPNYGPPNRGIRLREGMAIAIEPMVNVGSYDVVTLSDNWTVITKDGLLCAHFEHTVAITQDGPVLMTVL